MIYLVIIGIILIIIFSKGKTTAQQEYLETAAADFTEALSEGSAQIFETPLIVGPIPGVDEIDNVVTLQTNEMSSGILKQVTGNYMTDYSKTISMSE